MAVYGQVGLIRQLCAGYSSFAGNGDTVYTDLLRIMLQPEIELFLNALKDGYVTAATLDSGRTLHRDTTVPAGDRHCGPSLQSFSPHGQGHNRFLGMKTVLGLIPHEAAGPIHDRIGHLHATLDGQAVHEDRLWVG